ncbi:MAG: hypothetical protein H0V95_03520 [Actinobacteria bacterium]|nr:hypothetical protein [Actinomycetota bacterium]MBA3555960.1 hypothetical protein [Gemmatimonadales bacterium]
MTITVLLILAVLWAAVLVPPALRSRSEGRRGETIGPLNYRLGSGGPGSGRSLGSMFNRAPAGPGGFRPAAFPPRPVGTAPVRAGAPTGPPGEMTPPQKRRRDILALLLAGVGLTFVLAVFTGVVALWLFHLLTDALLGGYVYLLLRMKQNGGVVGARSSLPPPIPLERPRQARHVAHRSPELALRRTAGQ